MSLLMILAASGRQPVLQPPVTFTANTTWTAPAGVTSLVSASGRGAAGTPASSFFVQRYSRTTVTYNRNPSTGEIFSTNQGTTYGNGPVPGNYCDPETPLPNGNVTYNCYDFADASYMDTTPATTGASATGFGKTFPGGVGGAASTTTFTNIAITPNTGYSIVVPSGGSITITYYG